MQPKINLLILLCLLTITFVDIVFEAGKVLPYVQSLYFILMIQKEIREIGCKIKDQTKIPSDRY